MGPTGISAPKLTPFFDDDRIPDRGEKHIHFCRSNRAVELSLVLYLCLAHQRTAARG